MLLSGCTTLCLGLTIQLMPHIYICFVILINLLIVSGYPPFYSKIDLKNKLKSPGNGKCLLSLQTFLAFFKPLRNYSNVSIQKTYLKIM